MKLFVSIPMGSEVMKTFVPAEVKEYIEERFEVTYSKLERQLKPEEIVQYAGDADVIMTGWCHPMITGDILEKTSIKLIAHTGGSVANIVDRSVYDKGVKVISGNDMYADSVAEGVLAYMFAALRKIPDYVSNVRTGGWKFGSDYTEGLWNQTVGIVGMGAISKRVIKLLRPFGVNLKLYSSHPIDPDFLKENQAEQVSLEELFSTSKIVSLHSAMNEKTKGMIGKRHFDLLQDGALFINTARGGIVREEEMIATLRERRFSAFLDVYCNEPLHVDSELRTLPNVYCMPHMAGPTVDRRPAVTKSLANDICRFGQGNNLEMEISWEHAKRMTVNG